jgi:hypothetical protein
MKWIPNIPFIKELAFIFDFAVIRDGIEEDVYNVK